MKMISTLLGSILSRRWTAVWLRNFLFWKKIAISSILGNLADPLIYLFALGLGMGTLVHRINDAPYTSFLASGIVASGIMLSASFEATYAFFTRMKGQRTWESILHTPLNLMDVLIGEIIWATSKAMVSGLAIVIVGTCFGYTHPKGLLILPEIFLISFCFSCIGSVITSLAQNYDFFLFYQTLFLTPTMLLSGVFFPTEQISTKISWLIKILPLYHAVEIVRKPLLGESTTLLREHIIILIFYSLTSLSIGYYFFRKRLLE